MIKIGHLHSITETDIPESISKSVQEDLSVLDFNYGSNRDIDNDAGGFVVICEKDEIISIPYFNEYAEEFEYRAIVGGYDKRLYVSGTERNIILYRKC